MGERIPEPPDDYGVGDDCLHCFAAGKTPNYLFVRFWNVTPCSGKPNIPNGYCFTCAQVPSQPCQFIGDRDFEGVTWRAYLDMHAAFGGGHRAEISLGQAVPPGVAAFFGWTTDCGMDFDTNLQSCPGDGGEGGRAIVTIYIDPIIIALTSAGGLVTRPGILYDYFHVDDPFVVYHIAHTHDRTNVLFLIDRDNFPPP